MLEDIVSQKQFLFVLVQFLLKCLDDLDSPANDLAVVTQFQVVNALEDAQNFIEIFILDAVEFLQLLLAAVTFEREN